MFLAGCAVVYRYGDRQYASREAALRAVDADIEATIAAIPPTSGEPVGTALFALPSREIIEKNGVMVRGNSLGPVRKAMVDYVATASDKGYEAMYRATVKRRLFSQVSCTRTASPASASSEGFDYLVYFNLINPQTAQWYIRGKHIDPPQAIPTDTGKRPGVERTLAWLDSLERIARASPPARAGAKETKEVRPEAPPAPGDPK